MEFIAEAMHASIELTQTDCDDTVNDLSQPRALSPCSTTSVQTPVDRHHLEHDSYPTAFYRPESVEQQPAVFSSHYAAPPLVSPKISLEKITLSLGLLNCVRNVHPWNPSAT